MDKEYYVHESAFIDEDVEVGARTKVWHNSHISRGARIGSDCSIGQGVYIGNNVVIGDGCKLQNNVNIYDGVTLENNVFFGPNSTTTNAKHPRSCINIPVENYKKTLVKDGASIGASAVLVCKNGSTLIIGENATVGSGAIVTKDVAKNTTVVGNPAVAIL